MKRKLDEVISEKPSKICPICKKEFYQPRHGPPKLFCSPVCAREYQRLKYKFELLKKRLPEQQKRFEELKKKLEEIEKILERNKKVR